MDKSNTFIAPGRVTRSKINRTNFEKDPTQVEGKKNETIQTDCTKLLNVNSIDSKLNIVPNESKPALLSNPEQKVIARIEFKINEVIWAKLRGFKPWPAKICSFPSNKMVEVIWFNDYRRTKLYKTQLFKFLQYFDEFAKNFSTTVGLETAAKEALIYYGQNVVGSNMEHCSNKY